MFGDSEMIVFMEELEEKIQSINDNILILEKEGGSTEVIQEIFRAAHTIKGSSGVMGFEKMSRLTHEIENLFDRLRHGTMEVTTHLVDVLFEALDILKLLKDEITGEASNIGIDDFMVKIRDIQKEKTTAAGGEVEAPGALAVKHTTVKDARIDDVIINLVREAEVRGYQVYWVDIGIDINCQMKNVRAFLVFETLQQAGEIIYSSPPAEELQEGNYLDGFAIALVTKEDPDYISSLVMSIAETTGADISQVDSGDDSELAVAVKTSMETLPKKNARPDEDSKKAVVAEKGQGQIKTVRVDVQKLDKLMNLVSELVIDRTRLDRFVDIFENKYSSETLVENLSEISNHLGQITSDLQEEIMKARMLPVATVFNRLPRMVRDIAQKLGKEIDFIVEGQETELDRNVIEIIGDPLIHLIRNAIDHGIESPEARVKAGKPKKGRVLLKASYFENQIIITLTDDGRGIQIDKLKQKAVEKGLIKPDTASRITDREVMDLMFAPGMSTVDTVSDVSGRGVGMDIVKNQIEQINGTLEYSSEAGQGTVFNIRLPLTLVIVRALMVGMGENVYAFALSNVMETLSINESEIKLVRHAEVIVLRGRVLPLVRLARLYNLPENRDSDKLFVVVLRSGERRVGIVVEKLIGEQEIVIKSLGGYLGNMTGLSGATILGDGRVALIIDAKGIMKDTGVEDVAHASN